MTRAGYRASQFVHALLANPAAEDSAQAAAFLPPGLRFLFNSMRRAERAHSLAVLRALLRVGHTDPDLLAAALLHDVGKTRAPLQLFDRVLVVLTQHLVPASASAWSIGEPSGWNRPWVVAARHADWGAEMIAQAGGSPRLEAIIRRHHDSPLPNATEIDRLLAALQAADGSH
jgi:putative nucleotidyltransferase with HDIG domain